ncbi:MAG: hypothetical protein E7290_13240 [Lachnospiraceae bacterium]|nr:hypothetical protein [Lachnospiraceae bacterium]
MNGINYNSLLANTGLYSNSATATQEELKTKGKASQETEAKNAESRQDTVEINGQSRAIPVAGYSRPKRVEPPKEHQYKEINEEGIQEGIELSDAAKALLEELRAKYGNMDIKVANWSTDAEQAYYAKGCEKEYSVLIAPEALEEMAANAEVRAEYEAVLDGAGEKSAALKEELGEDYERIAGFQITIDKDGAVSYAVRLLQDFNERNAKRAEDAEKALEEKRAEKKEAEREAEEAVRRKRYEKIEAASMDELIAAIKERLGKASSQEVIAVEES